MSARNKNDKPEIRWALAAGGLDPSGASGLIADVRTFAAFGLHPTAVMTAATVQSVHSARGYRTVEPALLREQLDLLFETQRPSAVKIGMVGSQEVVRELARALSGAGRGIPVVLDPVQKSSSGAPLIDPEGLRAMVGELIPLATVITSRTSCTNREQAEKTGKKLLELGADYVLLTGGHFEGPATDLLFGPEGVVEIPGIRVPGPDVRGTGCCFSSALAAGLALDRSVPDAAGRAKDFVTAAIGEAVVVQKNGKKRGIALIRSFQEKS